MQCSTLTLPNAPVGRVLVTGAGNTVTHSEITTTQLGYARGLTGPVQAALETSLPTGLAASRVLVSNSAGVLDVSDVSVNELEFVRGLSGSINTQLAGAGTQVVSMPYTWSTNGLALQNSPLQFTPEPLRTYVVDAHLIVYANATDHTSSYGVRWPSLQNSNAGIVTMSYQANASTAAYMRSAGSTTDPLCVVQSASLANVPWMLSMRAVFATGPTVSTPFAIVANTNVATRWAHLLYGSHIAYSSHA